MEGSPVAAVIVNTATTSPALRGVTAAVFADWQRVIRERLRRGGWSVAEADSRATLALAAIEGALLLSRAQRNTAPLLVVADHVARIARPPHASETDGTPAQ